ncbi:MAG: hypothetical protein BWX50_01283 [Euryarchaeota archaeon ADurb.Bin009]|nr:MAG: hypothetical protein BWY94_02529 [Actinobacteria bacterium ADurb.BinA094]OPZ40275.1 MAG: hypothetical protein BWY94_02528 [Actinobacteria bacterium ADurb.BinA094]OQC68180.1 MAG: hypothetical protein BWX50_01283 [Euryarchaeota archaeon ADurb.Bin009]
MKDPRPDKEDLVRPRRPCGGKVAPEHLPGKRRAAIAGRDGRLDAALAEVGRHRVDEVDVLDGRDEADPAGGEEGEGAVEHGHVEVEPDGFVYDARAVFDRRVAEMDQNVGVPEGVERKVAGTVTGVAADEHEEPCVAEGGGHLRRLPRKPGGELEGDGPRPAFVEFCDEVRDRYQRHAPGPRRPRS